MSDVFRMRSPGKATYVWLLHGLKALCKGNVGCSDLLDVDLRRRGFRLRTDEGGGGVVHTEGALGGVVTVVRWGVPSVKPGR